MSRFKLKVLLSFLLIGFMIALAQLEIPGNTFLSREIHNAGHFPFFGLISLLLLGLLSQFLERKMNNRLWLYLLAFIATLSVGALHEYSQIIGPRDADIWDLVRDAAGAAAFLGLYMNYDKQMKVLWKKRGGKIRKVIFIAAIILVLSALIPVALWGGAYLYRGRVFPTICNFESYWGNKFLMTKDTIIKTTLPPIKWKNKAGNRVGKITFHIAEHPGFAVEEPFPNWTFHKLFIFEVFSDLDFSVKVYLRIEDSRHNNDHNDRFNCTLTVDPGLNKISIPLDNIREAPAARDMDMEDIRLIHFFVYKPDKEFDLYFDDFRLE